MRHHGDAWQVGMILLPQSGGIAGGPSVLPLAGRVGRVWLTKVTVRLALDVACPKSIS